MHVIASFLGLNDVQLALLVSGVALVYGIRRWRISSVRKRTEQSSSTPVSDSHPLSVREVAAEISALLSDLEETARRVAAQIDNRRTGLELLLKEADEKIKRLESLTKSSGSTADSPRPTPPLPAVISADAAQLISRLRQERGALAANEDPSYRPIYQLADAGKSSREIAQQLNRQPGEVELILALRPKQRAMFGS